jgi:hypothetical protein
MSRKTLALLGVLVAIPSTALAADQVGPADQIADLQVNQPTSDTYLQYHGRIFIGKGNKVDEYRWGGLACGSRVLTDHAVMLLHNALASGLNIEPRYENGQGQSLCLVGFTFSD